MDIRGWPLDRIMQLTDIHLHKLIARAKTNQSRLGTLSTQTVNQRLEHIHFRR